MNEFVLREVLSAMAMVVGYLAGFLPVYVFSFGWLEPGSFSSLGDGEFYRSRGLKWWRLTFVKNGQRFLLAEVVALLGWGMILVSLILGWLASRLLMGF